ncbi:MAG: exopolysaccharide biosynthesis polyprenyl glycosylphosphotransferase [Clostridia bacterium]
MNKTSCQFLVVVNVLTDFVMVLAAYLLSSWLWLDVWKDTTRNMAFVRSLRDGAGLAASIYALVLVVMMAFFHLYAIRHTIKRSTEFLHIVEANILGVFCIGAALYLFRLQDFSRGVLALFLFFSILFVCAKHELFRAAVNRMFREGYFHKNVLIIGTGLLAAQYDDAVRNASDTRISITGCVGGGENPSMAARYLGGFDVLESHLLGSVIDEAIIALDVEETSYVRPMIALCDKCGTRASVIPFYCNDIPSTPQVEVVGSSKLINLRSNQLDNLGFAAFKRAFDIAASMLLLIVLCPLLLVLAICVKCTSPGPVFFRQQRVGLNKKLFTMYKFRSMRVNTQQNTAWTTNADPRKTPFGSFIRKCSLDELPQLFNVFRGDMSLVGPRPELPYYVNQFKEDVPLYMVKHQVRPGMTGWAQVNGYRGDTSIQKRIEHDIWYIEHMSIRLDAKVLCMTLFGSWLNSENIAAKDASERDKHSLS